jgi:hypothetical protein
MVKHLYIPEEGFPRLHWRDSNSKAANLEFYIHLPH